MKPQVKYEPMRHGMEAFPIAFYSERDHGVVSHYHREYEIFHLSQGRMRVGVGDEEYVVEAGSTLFINPGENHYATEMPDSGPSHFYSLLFDVTALGGPEDPTRQMLESIRVNRFLNTSKEIVATSEGLFNLLKSEDFGAEIFLKTYLFSTIAHIVQSRQYTRLSTLHGGRMRSAAAVNEMIAYIEAHYMEKITVSDVLDNISYSKSHAMRLFREVTGCSVVSYINRYRVEKSCLELLYSSKSISDIAIDNGFNNVQYFSKMFRMYMNNTPGKYRAYSRSFPLLIGK